MSGQKIHKPRDRNSMPSIMQAEALDKAAHDGGLLIEFDWQDSGKCLVWTTRSHARAALKATEQAQVPQRASWCTTRRLLEGVVRIGWFVALDTLYERRRKITDAGKEALARWRKANQAKAA